MTNATANPSLNDFLELSTLYQWEFYFRYLSLLWDRGLINPTRKSRLLSALREKARRLDDEFNYMLGPDDDDHVDVEELAQFREFAQKLFETNQLTPRHLVFHPEPCQYT